MSTRLFPKNTVFISTTQLKPLLLPVGSGGQVSLIDLRCQLGNPTYGKKQHDIKRPAGSMFIDVDGPLCDAAKVASKTGGRHPLPTVQDFQAFCERTGIGRKPVVCFDDLLGSSAVRLWWMLDSLNVEAYVLDGGFPAYCAEPESEFPCASGADSVLTQVAEPFPPGSWPFTKHLSNPQWPRTATIDDLPSAKLFFDARAPARFETAPRPVAMDPINGHIPGAKNWFWASLTKTGNPNDPSNRLKSTEELKKDIDAKLQGLDPSGNDVIVSCGSGVTACFNLAVMRHVGVETLPRLYVGSFSEFVTVKLEDIVKEHIEKQGFALALDPGKTLPQSPELGENGGPVTVDGTQFKTVADALAATKNEQLTKILPKLHVGESGRVFTNDVVFKVSA